MNRIFYILVICCQQCFLVQAEIAARQPGRQLSSPSISISGIHFQGVRSKTALKISFFISQFDNRQIQITHSGKYSLSSSECKQPSGIMYPMPIRQIPSRHPGRNRITGNNLRISQGPLCRIPEHSKSIRSPGNPVASQRSCNRPGRRIRKQTGISHRLSLQSGHYPVNLFL